MKLVTVSQMIAIEKEANAKGVTNDELMQHAGTGIARLIHQLGHDHAWHTITGIVGSGNNGGDALVALTWLAQEGWWTRAYLVRRKLAGDGLIKAYLSAGGEICEAEADTSFETLHLFLNESNILLDGLLGTGIKLPLRPEAAQVLEHTNTILSELDPPPFVVAVDCPSGVNCDTGDVAEEAIPADLTITMAAAKQGLLKLPAFELIGDLKVVEIGLPDHLDSWDIVQTEAADWDVISALLPERTPASHKGTFGTAFVVAGSTSYTGAALLAGTAAYRVGAGLVTMAIPEPLHAALAGHLPEATWVLLPHENGFISQKAGELLLQNLERATAFLIGPGLGNHLCTRMFVEEIIPSVKIPLVIDADGLRHVSHIKDWHKKLFGIAVLTPHPGEMSVLTGLTKEDVQDRREEVAVQYAKEWGHVVVLKGAFTIIASPDGRSMMIPVATPALARAGTGDVLAGLIAGLRAQGLNAYDAAVAGAFIHAQAGLLAAEDLGSTASVLASDVLNSIADILNALE